MFYPLRPVRHSKPLTLAAVCLLAACVHVPEPGIRVGEGLLQHAVLCELVAVGEIQAIARLPIVPEDGAAIWIGGEEGVARITPEGAVHGLHAFEQQAVNPAPIDLDEDGAWETMDRGEGWADVKLLDAAGNVLWGYPPGRSMMSAADAMAAGPVGADGALGFVVGMNASGGLRALDRDGLETWRVRAINVFSVEVADLDGDGRSEILHSDWRQGSGFGLGAPRVWVRDADGCPERELRPGFTGFSLLRWPERDSPLKLLGITDGDTLRIFDPSVEPHGQQVAEYELPDEGFADVTGVLLHPAPGAAPYLVVTRTIRATWHRSALYAFDPQGQLVYHEVFPVADIGLAVVPAEPAPGDSADVAEELLVGIGPTVWRYTLRTEL